jgi:GATA-binding protein, other eukaryote
VKTTTKPRDSTDGQQIQTGYPAAHPDVASAGLNFQQPSTQIQQFPSGDIGRIQDINSISRSNTPGNGNIAPPHIFDNVSLPSDAFGSPSLPAFALRQPSPGATSTNGHAGQIDAPQTYDALQAQNQHFKTRVNELEVIQDLFRGRVDELERSEKQAKETAKTKTEEAERLTAELEAANAKVEELQKRLSDAEAQSTPSRKRTRRAAAEEGEAEGDT